MPPFLLPTGNRTRSGPHHLFCRFSDSSRENTWKKVKGSQREGWDLWSGLALQGSFFICDRRTLNSSGGHW